MKGKGMGRERRMERRGGWGIGEGEEGWEEDGEQKWRERDGRRMGNMEGRGGWGGMG